MNFSKILFTLRKENEFSAKTLASKIGFSTNIIYDWEKGRAQPNIETLIKLAEIFEVSVGYLIGAEDDFGNVTVNAPAQELTYREKRLLKAFSSLSDNIQDKLIDDAEFYAEQYAGESKYNKRA